MSLLSSADVSISLNFHLICRFFTPPLLAPLVSCNVPPLSQLNVASIHCKALKSIAKRAPPMFRLVANSSDCLPVTSPLFLNHIWICSQIISGFVPRTSTHLFPIGCGPGSNCEGGFLEQESPYLLLRCFHISPSTRRPSAAAACLLVAAHTWGGLASDC